MRSFIFQVILCLLPIFNILGQTSLNDLNIVFKHDFENNTLGTYLYNEWRQDWLYPEWCDRQSSNDIVRDTEDPVNPTKALQINFPANSVGTAEGGTQWWTQFDKHDELYISYDIKFMPGFEFALGGKLPSLRGGDLATGEGFIRPSGYDGFTGGMMFKENGAIVFYTYFPDSKITRFGETIYWGGDYASDAFSPSNMKIEYGRGSVVYAQPGEWHNITYRMVMNSLESEGVGNYDGILEAYYDGQLVTQISHMLFRLTENLGINVLNITSFFGGSGDEWRNPIEEWLQVDNVIVYTFKDGIDVPRGNVLSPTNRTINYWRNFTTVYTEKPAAPSSLTATNKTKSSISLGWNDNSANEYGFKIYRSNSPTGDFTEIASVPANVTTYTDNSLQPGTTYYYYIRAYNNIGFSDYTAALSVTTITLQLPSAPSSLNISDISYTYATLIWEDNANNETGFEIECSGPNDFTQKRIITLAANTSTYTDNNLDINASYRYRIRSFNEDGFSDYSTYVEIKTLYISPPDPPTMLKSIEYNEHSISMTWNDNSDNESNFFVYRVLASDQSIIEKIKLDANTVQFSDSNLISGTTYIYLVKAYNIAGYSDNSNQSISTTLSHAETLRTRDGLIAYYNFGYNPYNVIYDQSGFEDPVDLNILNIGAVDWAQNNILKIHSNTAIVSSKPATKIVNELKKTNELTFDCWIKPLESNNFTDSRIITLGNNDNEVGFILNQNQSTSDENKKELSYSVRLQTESTISTGYPEYISDVSVNYLKLSHIAFVRDTLGNETLYINGIKSSKSYRPNLINNWDDNFYLRLGNEEEFNHPWKGSFYSFAIYNRALSEEEILLNYKVGPRDSIASGGIDFNIKIYPNPVIESVTIELTPIEEKDLFSATSIRIIDLYGKIVQEEILFNPNAGYIKTYDFKNYAKGIYFLNLSSDTNQQSEVIIVQ